MYMCVRVCIQKNFSTLNPINPKTWEVIFECSRKRLFPKHLARATFFLTVYKYRQFNHLHA